MAAKRGTRSRPEAERPADRWGVRWPAATLAAGLFSAALPLSATHREGKMEIKSSAFQNGRAIPKKYAGEGEDVSPSLIFSGVPDKAESLALTMDDPDAPPGTWVHWLIYDLPPKTPGLPEGLPRKETLPDGSKQGLCWGVESFDRVGYYGPLPPPGKPHRYFFKLYALDRALGLKPRATKSELIKAMAGHILAEARLMGTYRR